MENQVNDGDQNTQQIGQNQVSQPVITSEKPKTNYLLIVVAVLVSFVVFGFGGYYLGKQSSNPQQYINNKQNQTISTVTPEANLPSSSPTSSTTQGLLGTPEKNVLYLGMYNGKEAIFITNEIIPSYSDPNIDPKLKPYIGELNIVGAGGGYSPFDFNKLQSPKKIFSSPDKIHSINGSILNNTKNIAYISLNYGKEVNGTYPSLTNKIIQTNLDSLITTELWSNEIGSKKYEGAGGAAYPKTVEADKFLTIPIINCYACEGTSAGTIILNIITKTEKYYKNIGNIQFNISGNTFSYQKLAPFQEPCDPSPGCDNGQRTVMKPAGQTYTENLP